MVKVTNNGHSAIVVTGINTLTIPPGDSIHAEDTLKEFEGHAGFRAYFENGLLEAEPVKEAEEVPAPEAKAPEAKAPESGTDAKKGAQNNG